MANPHVVIVGADKGGVGKTTISRTLMDYYKAHGIVHRAFDTECPNGVLKRFHPGNTEIADLTKSDGQMSVLDTLHESQVTLIDMRAGLLSDTLRMLSEIGYLDGIKENRLRITVMHVLGASQASFNEIRAVSELVEGAKQHLVVNRINDSAFTGLPDELKKVGAGLIEVGKLDALAAETVDNAGQGFNAFVADLSRSSVMRGYVKAWLGRTFKSYDAAQLNAL